MLPELARLKSHELPDHTVEAAERFLETGDPEPPRRMKKIGAGTGADGIGEAVLGAGWSDRARLLVRFFTHFSEGALGDHRYLAGILGYAHDSDTPLAPEVVAAVVEEIESAHESPGTFMEWYFVSGNNPAARNWRLAAGPGEESPFVSPVANFLLRHVTPAHAGKLWIHPGFLPVLALQRPEVTRAWCELTAKSPTYYISNVWKAIITTTPDYDGLCLECCEEMVKKSASEAFATLAHLNEARGGVHAAKPMELVRKYPVAALEEDTLKYLMKHHPDEVIPLMAQACADPAVDEHVIYFDSSIYQKVFVMAYGCWETGGSGILKNLLATVESSLIETLLTEVFKKLRPEHYPVLREGILERMKDLDAEDQLEVWKGVAVRYAGAFLPEFEAMLGGSSKQLRELAAKALAKVKKGDGGATAAALLESAKPSERLGGVALLQKQGGPAAIAALQAAFEKNQPDAVRTALIKALAACGVKAKAPQKDAAAARGLAELEAELAKTAAKLKRPGTGWFKALELPALFAKDGSGLSEEATTFLIAMQAKHKEMDPAPECVALLDHIDRAKSAPFALVLVQGFLKSAQAAGDRWALVLGALTGDARILPPLVTQIHAWCKGTRGKLAEHAVEAMVLLPGKEPLAAVESLAARYRSKPRNVGKAAARAFTAAAEARSITPEELSDEVAPDLGFDGGGKRLYEWQAGKMQAVLEQDFKLSWFDPKTGKAAKSLPASAPPEVKAEVKALGKLLKETVEEQAARLEMAMVCQRRWPVARWRELYEKHPLLRTVTGGLVLGIYDKSGTLLRSFRRYPNGLLANAAGDLEELPEGDARIGIAHPLELDAAALDAWRGHLARFKAEPAFPQVGRRVELRDPLHGNRSELPEGKRRAVEAAGFRSRYEKHGWLRGPLTSEGEIACIFKPFPGLGIEAMLVTGRYSPMTGMGDDVNLQGAYFMKAGSAESDQYLYDRPKTDDPNLLKFEKVPPTLWSEVVCELKAIIGES